jgi:sporulation protein YlmC with PRC-barrel domain
MFKPVILSVNAGYKAQNNSGEDLGKIEEIVIDQDSGRVMYAVLSHGGFLHGGNRLVALPWQRLRMQDDQKKFLMNIDRETLHNAPHFERNNWPDMALPEWREGVETYFAYNPADEKDAAEGGEFIDSGFPSASIQERTSDERLARRVEFELFSTRAFDMETLHVSARDARVTLRGRVNSKAEGILAENTCLAVDGVAGVVNRLTIGKAA